MNLLFFLTPKQDVTYIYEDYTLRQTLEKWEHHRYATIPIIRRTGEYVGSITEGDLLWGIKNINGLDLEAAEDIPVNCLPRRHDYEAVSVTTGMNHLMSAVLNQNFVPVVDDRKSFIGIVRRNSVMDYLYKKYKPDFLEQRGEKNYSINV